MRNATLFVTMAILVGSVTSCIPMRLKQAKEGLKISVAELPQTEHFVTVASRSAESYRRFGTLICYSAGAEIVVGTSLPSHEALESYVRHLERKGWIVVRDDYERSKELIRGEFELIDVNVNSPGWRMRVDEEYLRARETYPGFVYLAVRWYLPNRATCLGE